MEIHYIINGFIILISLFLYYMAHSFDPTGRFTGVRSPQFWPQSVLLIIIFIAVVSIITAYVAKKRGGVERINKEKINYNKLTAAFCLAALYAFSMEYIGFILSTFIFQVLFLYLQGIRKKVTLVITPLSLTTLVYAIFVQLMSILLPRGIGIFRSFSLLFY